MFPPTGFHLSMVSKATANGFPKCLASDLLWTNSKAGLAPLPDDVTERDDSAGQSSDESDGARMGRLSQQQGRTNCRLQLIRFIPNTSNQPQNLEAFRHHPKVIPPIDD